MLLTINTAERDAMLKALDMRLVELSHTVRYTPSSARVRLILDEFTALDELRNRVAETGEGDEE